MDSVSLSILIYLSIVFHHAIVIVARKPETLQGVHLTGAVNKSTTERNIFFSLPMKKIKGDHSKEKLVVLIRCTSLFRLECEDQCHERSFE